MRSILTELVIWDEIACERKDRHVMDLSQVRETRLNGQLMSKGMLILTKYTHPA
jgi:hypothetical protein